jgi:hypothetical protein
MMMPTDGQGGDGKDDAAGGHLMADRKTARCYHHPLKGNDFDQARQSAGAEREETSTAVPGIKWYRPDESF